MVDGIKLTVDISGANKKILDFTPAKRKDKERRDQSALNIQRNAKGMSCRYGRCAIP